MEPRSARKALSVILESELELELLLEYLLVLTKAMTSHRHLVRPT